MSLSRSNRSFFLNDNIFAHERAWKGYWQISPFQLILEAFCYILVTFLLEAKDEVQ